MANVAAWWTGLRAVVPPDIAGLWFGLVELVPGGWHLYAVGTAMFDAGDATAEWAVGPYRWEPEGRYLALSNMESVPFRVALDRVASLVREIRPWEGLSIEGVAVGFDDGDFVVLHSR